MRNIGHMILDFIELLLISTTVFIVVYLFVGQLMEVTGDSMYPTFKDKEQLVAEKVSIKYREIERGEILIFRHPSESKYLIKRVIGLPGETITLKNGKVYINGEIVTEEYLGKDVVTQGGKIIEENIEYQISYNAYVLMGDNRSKSTDSRDWGPVTKELILGRGILVYYPLQNLRIIR